MEENKSNKIAAIVPAAGLGRRFVTGQNKPLYVLFGKPLVVWALQALQSVEEISEIVPVVKEEDLKIAAELVGRYEISKVRRIVPGGAERQDSVYNGLRALDKETSVVVIHDGARPFVTGSLIKNTILELQGVDGVITGVPLKDTIKEVKKRKPAVAGRKQRQNGTGSLVKKTLDRQVLRAIQTPQTFRFAMLLDAHERARAEGLYATDDAALIERYGGSIRVIEGSYSNLKITTFEDICFAEILYLKSCA
ncbi:MAG: 2-C-methyl-D-erythritol 4-phosphate cytidylyltransferase [Nitrospirae bacterium]|nr:2-C-methyl-D-erythritol 4-phosphate cytidylyltransferase [Nitrospirota bacterium]